MKRFVSILTVLALIASCSNKNTEPVKEEGHDEETQSNFVSLTEVQMKTAGIELGTIELKNLKTSIRANGMLTVPNQNKAFITTINNGVLKTLNIQPGSFVRKGQVVATILNPEIPFRYGV